MYIFKNLLNHKLTSKHIIPTHGGVIAFGERVGKTTMLIQLDHKKQLYMNKPEFTKEKKNSLGI